jgi:hypothetical protein
VRRRIYIETTIPSFYHETRVEPEMVARREWTRLWWAKAGSEHEVVTSEAGYDEPSRGVLARERSGTSVALGIGCTPTGPMLRGTGRRGSTPQLLSRRWRLHRCDFLVTWNCRHLANANKFGHIRRVNTLLGLYVPSLVTPLELLEDDENED